MHMLLAFGKRRNWDFGFEEVFQVNLTFNNLFALARKKETKKLEKILKKKWKKVKNQIQLIVFDQNSIKINKLKKN